MAQSAACACSGGSRGLLVSGQKGARLAHPDNRGPSRPPPPPAPDFRSALNQDANQSLAGVLGLFLPPSKLNDVLRAGPTPVTLPPPKNDFSGVLRDNHAAVAHALGLGPYFTGTGNRLASALAGMGPALAPFLPQPVQRPHYTQEDMVHLMSVPPSARSLLPVEPWKMPYEPSEAEDPSNQFLLPVRRR